MLKKITFGLCLCLVQGCTINKNAPVIEPQIGDLPSNTEIKQEVQEEKPVLTYRHTRH